MNCVQSKIPNLEKNSLIAILFLAHNGVTQPELWEDWKAEVSPKKIQFFVHANEGVELKDPFVCKYNIPPKYRIYKTKWCDSSLVWAFQTSIQYILELYKEELSVIYFVSGDAIPIRPSSHLIQLPPRTRFCLTERGLISSLKKNKCKQPFNFEQSYFKERDIIEHTQFLSISKEHAILFSKFNLNHFNKLDEYATICSDNYCPDKGQIKLQCPDEYFVGSVLKSMGVRNNQFCLSCDLMFAYRSNRLNCSPILWTNWTDVFEVDEQNEMGQAFKFNLQQAIEYAAETGTYFLRKIASSVIFNKEKEKPWTYILNENKYIPIFPDKKNLCYNPTIPQRYDKRVTRVESKVRKYTESEDPIRKKVKQPVYF